jgi:uncharacterized protein YabE (DUF348 family)
VATVADVLAAEGVEVTDKDLVAPAVDEAVTDGSAIAVQFGRPLEVAVDGESHTYWVNSTNVASALGEIGRRFEGADLSASRGSSIGRSGLTLDVVTPKVVHLKLGAKQLKKRKMTALIGRRRAQVGRLRRRQARQGASLAHDRYRRRRQDRRHRHPRGHQEGAA